MTFMREIEQLKSLDLFIHFSLAHRKLADDDIYYLMLEDFYI